MSERYTLEEVVSRRAAQEFLELPKRLYKNEPHWICPLDSDIEGRFDPKVNELMKEGEIIRWIVRDAQGVVVGRLAAFYNRELVAVSEGQPTGGCGYFESIDDQQVANLMFDAARDWLSAKGIEAMDGPINFGDRDQWWGLLVKGFDVTPLYTNNYNFEYYIALFENYGFQNYFNQHTYWRELREGLFPPNVYERVKRLNDNPSYRFEHIRKSHLDKYASDFLSVYNKAWSKFPGLKPIDQQHAEQLMRKLRPIIDERLMYFAYYNDEPIGFFLMFPDLNGVIQPFNGKFGWIEKLRFMWRLKVSRKSKRIFALIFGVTPDFQGKGIESGMIYAFERQLIAMQKSGKQHYKSLELAWIGDFNPLMMRMVETIVCAQKFKMHTTYRYLFDREKPFTRAPRLGGYATPKNEVKESPATETASPATEA